MNLAWLLLVLAVQVVVGFGFPGRVGFGLLSGWLARCLVRRGWPRGAAGPLVRLVQLVALIPAPDLVGAVSRAELGEAVWGIGVIVLYLDDYVFGEDDRWKRLREWTRNKVKWKMKLPAPARPRSGTA